MSDADYSKSLWRTSGFKAFWICAALAGLGALVMSTLWRAGGIVLLVAAGLGMIVFQYSRDWRHPWRFRRGGSVHRSRGGFTVELGDDDPR